MRGVVKHLRLREVESLRILPRAVHQPRHAELRDVDQHQRHEDLVGVELGPQERGNGRPQRPADRTGHDHHRQQERVRAAREVERDAAAGDRADDVLAFGSDVPDVGAKADGEADGDQHQRRRLEQELRPSVRILQRAQEEHAKALDRILAERGEDHESADERERDREERRRIAHRIGGLGPCFEPRPHDALPSPIRRPATCRSSRRRSPRRWCRPFAWSARAGRWR